MDPRIVGVARRESAREFIRKRLPRRVLERSSSGEMLPVSRLLSRILSNRVSARTESLAGRSGHRGST